MHTDMLTAVIAPDCLPLSASTWKPSVFQRAYNMHPGCLLRPKLRICLCRRFRPSHSHSLQGLILELVPEEYKLSNLTYQVDKAVVKTGSLEQSFTNHAKRDNPADTSSSVTVCGISSLVLVFTVRAHARTNFIELTTAIPKKSCCSAMFPWRAFES